ncbi:MAG: chemotaxis response regulator protein-glutamate methylesterase [Candidatus Neomarinimicrobiota bacterium]
MIKLVIVDDSAFMRKAIQIMVESEQDIKVVGMARDGEEGVEMVRELHPDVVTMDIEMPRMNGLEALEIIMRENPTPVLVVSSITTEGAAITLDALEKGAMDFIAKTQSFVAIDITKIKEDLLHKIRGVVKHPPAKKKAFLQALKRRQDRKQSLESDSVEAPVVIPGKFSERNYSMVAIGVSTGGPPVVQHILDHLPADFPVGIIVAQHMPEAFTKPFAERLNRTSPLAVKEAETGDRLTKGTVLIGRGGQHLVIHRSGTKVIAELTTKPDNLLYYPSVDQLFSSAVTTFGSQTLGVILTGMGHDGLKGLRELNAANGTILAQSEESCVVYGMPKAAVDAGIADIVTSAAQMPTAIKTLVD